MPGIECPQSGSHKTESGQFCTDTRRLAAYFWGTPIPWRTALSTHMRHKVVACFDLPVVHVVGQRRDQIPLITIQKRCGNDGLLHLCCASMIVQRRHSFEKYSRVSGLLRQTSVERLYRD
jgi:hypothetical protein